MTLTIYTKPNCPNCVILKNRLDQKQVDYDTIELNFGQETTNTIIEVVDFKTKFPGVTTMPFFEVEMHGQKITGGITQALKLFC